MRVFIDTSAFYAVISHTDANYGKSVEVWNRLLDDETVTLYTSNYVVVEACALIRNRLGHAALRDFLESLLPLAVVLWIDQTIHAAATEAMIATGANGPSLVDFSSFATMRANGIDHAFAYDKHFTGQGFLL